MGSALAAWVGSGSVSPLPREDELGSCQRGTGAAAVLLYRGSGSVFD